MSIFQLEPKEIKFSENDSVFINTSLSFESLQKFQEIGKDPENMFKHLKPCIFKIISDGQELEINEEVIKKLPMSIVLRIVKEMTSTIETTNEGVKKN